MKPRRHPRRARYRGDMCPADAEIAERRAALVYNPIKVEVDELRADDPAGHPQMHPGIGAGCDHGVRRAVDDEQKAMRLYAARDMDRLPCTTVGKGGNRPRCATVLGILNHGHPFDRVL